MQEYELCICIPKKVSELGIQRSHPADFWRCNILPLLFLKIHEAKTFLFLDIQKRRPKGRPYWTIRYNVSYFKL